MLNCGNSSTIHDHHLEKFISNLDIEELSVKDADSISGEFMINLQTNIKYLTLSSCQYLIFNNLRNAQILSQLKKLELNNNPIKTEDLPIIIAKMPTVESLSLNDYFKQQGYTSMSLMSAILKLTELKEFSMNDIATDALLEAIALGCKQLRSLHIEFCGVSGTAVVALCRELPLLAELNVAGCSYVTDDDLISCIAIAKNLTMLDSSYRPVPSALVAAAALDVRRRPRTFRLRLSGPLQNIEKMYEQEKRLGLVISWRKIMPGFEEYIEE